ncbi:MAG: PAS domain S-box protein [Calditrichaeota bacterium]|nr:PAS domain S-box protein [Calditrichota bacterium]
MANILIVDDEKSIRDTLSSFLIKDGHQVKVAEDADVASDLLKINNFDVIVTDIILPRIDGLNLLKSIHKDSPFVQVILMTGEPEVQTSIEAVREGAFDYLVKPITKDMIIKAVNNAAKVKAVDDERRRLEKENKKYQERLEKLVEERTKSLRESEERYSNIVAGLLVGVAIHVDNKIVFVNNSLINLLGHNSENSFIGKNILEFVHPDYKAVVASAIKSGLSGKGDSEPFIEGRLIKADGKIIVAEASAIEINYYGKSALMVMINDITASKQAEEKLFENEKRLQNIFESMSEGFSIQDVICDDEGNPVDLRFVEANPAFERQTGLKNSETLGHTLLELFPTSEKYWIERYGKVGITGEPITFEAMFGPLNIYYHVNAFQTRPRQFGVLFTDINERKLHEIELTIAKERAEENEKNLKLGQQIAQLGNWKLFPETNEITGSEELFKIFEMEPGNLTLDSFAKKFHPEDREESLEYIYKAIEYGEFWDVESRLQFKEGRVKWIRAIGEPQLDELKKVIAIVGIVQDITERKKAEIKLAQVLHDHEILLKNDPSFIIYKDTKNNIIKINDTAAKMSNLPKEKIEGKPSAEIYPAMADKYYADDKKIMKSGEPKLGIIEKLPAADGSIKWLLTNKVPVKNDDENVIGIALFSTDITDLKQTQDVLKESEERFTIAMNASRDGLYDWDLISNEIYYSPGWKSILGYEDNELPNDFSVWEKLTRPEDVERAWKMQQDLINKKLGRFEMEFKMMHKKGHWVDILSRAEAVFDGEKAIRIVGTHQDITERKKAEQKITQSETRLSNLMSNLPGMAYTCKYDQDWTMLFVNDASVQLTGYKPVQLINNSEISYNDLIHPDDRIKVRNSIDDSLRIGKHFELEYRITSADGKEKWVWEKGIRSGKFDDGTILLEGVIHDITVRKQGELEIKKLTAALEQSPVSIVITSSDGTTEYVNPKYCELTGYTSEEAIGKMPSILKSGKHTQAFYSELWNTINSGNIWSGQFQNRKKNGELFWEDATIGPILNKEGNITHFVSMKEDITERIILQEQFQQAQKMESVARLAGGVAHDFNNMLAVILGYSEMALSELEPGNKLYNDIKQINSAGQRSADLTTQLLAFSRKQTIAPKLLNLNDCVTGMLKMLGRLIGEDIELSWEPGKDIWPVKMDPSQVDQVLANLCINARDAISGVGRITIKTKNVTFDKEYSILHSFAEAGDYISISVYDNGCGMDKETSAKIFEPFFTTKGVGKGTGLGLATVYGVVKQNEGLINVYSEPGQGTNFNLYFPKYKGGDVGIEEDEGKEIPKGNKEVIILVEDEQTILKMTESMLENLNYTVVAVNSPEEVLELVIKYDIKIDLLLTDVVMPKMNGKELASELTKHQSALKVLFMSGYTSEIITNRGVLDEGVNFISKPFSRSDIAIKIKEVLA